jgi:hypothetical protein
MDIKKGKIEMASEQDFVIMGHKYRLTFAAFVRLLHCKLLSCSAWRRV